MDRYIQQAQLTVSLLPKYNFGRRKKIEYLGLFPKLNLGKKISNKLCFVKINPLVYEINNSKLNFVEILLPKYNFGRRKKLEYLGLLPKLHLGKKISHKLHFELFVTYIKHFNLTNHSLHESLLPKYNFGRK